MLNIWLLTLLFPFTDGMKGREDAVIFQQIQPEIVRPTVSIGFVLPSYNLTNAKLRQQLGRLFKRAYLTKGANDDSEMKALEQFVFSARYQNIAVTSNSRRRQVIVPRFQVNPIYLSGLGTSEAIQRIFCSPAANGLNAVLILIDKTTQSHDECHLSSFIGSMSNNIGVPSLLWSSAITPNVDPFFSVPFADRKGPLILSPGIREIAAAIMAFLRSQALYLFNVVLTTDTPGANDFLEKLIEAAEVDVQEARKANKLDMHYRSRLGHISKLTVGEYKSPSMWREAIRHELMFIRDSTKARVIILWCDYEESSDIFAEARILGLGTKRYLWIGGKVIIGEHVDHTDQALPSSRKTKKMFGVLPGTVLVSYDTSLNAQKSVIKAASAIWTRAVHRLALVPEITANTSGLSPSITCSNDYRANWKWHGKLTEMLIEEASNMEKVVVTPGRAVAMWYLGRSGFSSKWILLANWSISNGISFEEKGVENWKIIRGAVSHDMASTFLRIVTLEEPPYIIYSPYPPENGTCPNNGVKCQLSPFRDRVDKVSLEFEKHPNFTKNSGISSKEVTPENATINYACCSGYCIDMLRQLAEDIGFKYELFEVYDRKWGGLDRLTGKWNGLVKTLIDEKADLALTSLKINQERSEAIDFTLPFLETGISIAVAVRPGAIPPTALTKPFSANLWLAIFCGCLTSSMLAIYIFENSEIWKQNFSKRKKNQDLGNTQEPRFTVFTSFWLALATLFRANAKVVHPKTIAGQMLYIIWSMCAVIFASSYMANLAVFMITKDEFYDFSGVDDNRLKNPFSKQPPFQFGTISSGATEAFFKQNYPEMFEYMRRFNQSSAATGMKSLQEGKLDAFIYDATVLEYLSNHDPKCRLAVVGKWYAMTGYGLGFPRGSAWQPVFNKFIIEYQYNGFLNKYSGFWLSGLCNFRKSQNVHKSFQLGVTNFLSPFVMLLLGLGVCLLLLCAEYLAYKFVVRYISKKAPTVQPKRPYNLEEVVNLAVAYQQKPSKQDDLVAGFVFSTFSAKCQKCGRVGHISQLCQSSS